LYTGCGEQNRETAEVEDEMDSRLCVKHRGKERTIPGMNLVIMLPWPRPYDKNIMKKLLKSDEVLRICQQAIANAIDRVLDFNLRISVYTNAR
jgi:hypothetical protein